MKKLILFSCFLFSYLLGLSKQIETDTPLLTQKNIPYSFNETWRFMEGDNPAWAMVEFGDSKWPFINSMLWPSDTADHHWFNGIGWFRTHFYIDTIWVNKPMLIELRHNGASEIYLDGKLFKSFGKINGKDSSTYFNPQKKPFIITFSKSGHHTLAVRYANYKANYNYLTYWVRYAGFEMSLNSANERIYESITTTAAVSFILSLLMGIFLALAIIHLFLFLYYRTAVSNLYFSLFAFCIASMCLIGFVRSVSNYPPFILFIGYLTYPLICTACITLTGLIHHLFYKKGKRVFYTIFIIYLAAIICPLLGFTWSIFIILGLGVISLLEAIILIIVSIKRKVKGSKIIGFGVLFFGLFILSLIFIGIIVGDITLEENSVGGILLMVLFALAILSMPISMSVYLAWSFSSVSKDLSIQLINVEKLSAKTIEQEQEKNKLITEQNILLEQKVEERTADLKAEKKKSDDLLLNILPAEIAEELKAKGETAARHFDMVSVLFTDFVNFTGISSTLTPTELVKEIDICFKAFDEIIERNGLEKIKTIGDAYLAVCGMPEPDKEHAIKVVRASIDIKNYISERKKSGGKFEIRMGIHSGPLVAGIVGIKKFAYDIWGDTVNLASRMESNSIAGKINISDATYELVKNDFKCEHRGKIEAKNKGMIDMYFVE